MNRVTVPFFLSHQGCPHDCIFCDQRTISGSRGTLPTTGDMLAKIREWQGSAGGRTLEVAFFGGTFTALPARVQSQLLDPLQPLLASGEVGSIRISTRPDCIDDTCVRWLANRGVTCIELGVQSMDDHVLARAGRGHDGASSMAALRCIADHGLSAVAQLMPGLPGDSASIALRSLHQVIAAGARAIRIYPVVVLRGTGLAAMLDAGQYQPLSVPEGVAICKVLLHAAMKAGIEVIRIGLQADEGLNNDTVLAGCWHPAFGQLVRSQLYADLLRQMAAPYGMDAPLEIRCHPARVSDVVGQGRRNMEPLGEPGRVIKIRTDTALRPEEVIMKYSDRELLGHVVTDITYDIREE